VEGALLNAPAGAVVAFVLCICKALHAHVLPDPDSQPREQVGLLLSHVIIIVNTLDRLCHLNSW
jgi:hypothetical protein